MTLTRAGWLVRTLGAAVWCTAALAYAADQLPSFRMDTLVGAGWTGDGRPAPDAVLIQPQDVAVDAAGNIFVSDAADHRVRRIGTDGIIRTVAGTGIPGAAGEGGPGTQAQLNAPYGLALDPSGNLYIADLGNALVRRLNASDGRLVTIAGGGTVAVPLAGSVHGTQARLVQPRDVSVDPHGNVYIADFGGHRVYQLTPSGLLSAVAGTGQQGSVNGWSLASVARLSYPSAVVAGASAVYIAESGNGRVRRLASGQLTTVSDRYQREIEFSIPVGLALDSAGRLYVAEGSPWQTAVVSPAGDVTYAPAGSSGVAITPGGDLITASARTVKRLTPHMILETLAGGPNAGNGIAPAEWRLGSPVSVLKDSTGTVWIADAGLGRLRALTAAGELITVTSALEAPVSLAMDRHGRVYAGDRAQGGAVYRFDTIASTPKLITRGENRQIIPAALACDPVSDALYIADSANDVIRRVDADGSVLIVAGGGREASDGVALQSKLSGVAGIAVDASGDVWLSEASTRRIRRLSPSGRLTTLAEAAPLEPRGLAFDRQGRLWVADGRGQRVFALDLSRPAPEWSVVAGSGDRGFSGDGAPALAGMLNAPSAVWVDASGSVLVADTGNARIRQLSPEAGGGTPAEHLTLAPVSVFHAATMAQDGFAPGQLIYVVRRDGSEWAPGVSATVAGLGASVIQTAGSRLTVQVPPGLSPGFAELAVSQPDGSPWAKLAVKVAPTAPGFLTSGADGSGPALALDTATWQPNTRDQPAEAGSVISLFLTGEGNAAPAPAADLGGVAAEVIWADSSPYLNGILEVRIRIPRDVRQSGAVPLTLEFGGVRTQAGVTLWLR